MTDHNGLPVAGYRPQSDDAVACVNDHKAMEERILRRLDHFRDFNDEIDPRWLAIARTHIEQGFMFLNRAVFKPGRVKLPEDAPGHE